MLLVGAAVLSMSSWRRGADLEEGAAQMEALLHFARAHAATTGRQVQLYFDEDAGEGFYVPLGRVGVRWEPDPVAAPGLFEDVREAARFVESLAELVSVEEVHADAALDSGSSPASISGTDSTNTTPAMAEGETSWALSFAPLTFYPDGSSDSAEIVLASRDEEDSRRLAVRLTGATGMLRRRLVELPTGGLP